EKVNRKRDEDRQRETERSELNDELFGEDEQAEDVGEVRHQQDGDEEALGAFRQPIEAQGGGPSPFHLVTQPDRIHREQAGFDTREEERDRPEQENGEAVDHV